MRSGEHWKVTLAAEMNCCSREASLVGPAIVSLLLVLWVVPRMSRRGWLPQLRSKSPCGLGTYPTKMIDPICFLFCFVKRITLVTTLIDDIYKA